MAVASAWLALGFAFSQHELWCDEAQAWLLSRAAPSFWSLFSGEARIYEGHPFAWFWLLRAASLLSASYLTLQGVAFVIAAANAALIAGLSGLPRWARVLLMFSYVTFFEFGVIARNYGLAVLGLLLALRASRLRSRWRALGVALCCALAANSVLLSVPAATLIVVVTCGEPLLRAWRGRRFTALLPELVAVAIYGSSVLLAVSTSRLPHDSVVQLAAWPAPEPLVLRALGEHLLTALFPVPSLSRGYDWWNTNWLLPIKTEFPAVPAGQTSLPAVLGAAWLMAWVYALRRRPLLALGLLSSAVLVAFTILRLPYRASRYDGHISLCLVVALGLAAAKHPGLVRKRWVAALTLLTLGASALSTSLCVALDHLYAFSQSRAAALALEQLGVGRAPLVGFEYYRMSPLATYLGRELWSPEHRRELSYGIWSTRIHHPGYLSISREVTRRGICHAAITPSSRDGGYLVSSAHLVPGPLGDDMKLVRALWPSSTEIYFIYRVAPLGSSAVLSEYCRDP